jgi:hypothetical protein
MLTESFCVWAPDESPWSPWVKPVLFAHMGSAISQLVIAETAGDVSWAPSPGERAALVLDLPGAEGTLTGLALAARGYRPVPLYNAVPVPYGQRMLDLATGSAVTAVNVFPIVSALSRGAEELAHLKLSADAPPAFLLDANRRGDGRKMKVGEFDNRSVSFTTDFPSANFLASQKIGRVILVQKDRQAPQTDLAHSPLAGCRADTRTETPGYARRASAFRGGPPFLVWRDVPAGIGRIRVASISQGRLRSMGSRALLGRVKARVRPASIAPGRRFDRRPQAGGPRSPKPRPAGN